MPTPASASENPPPARRRVGLILVGGVAVLLAGIGLLLIVLQTDDDREAAAGGATPVEAVLADPGSYTGRRITVTGRANVVTGRAMTLGDGDLIVVAGDAAAPSFEKSGITVGEAVTATGEVRILSADELVESLPRTSILPSQFQEFEREAVLVAEAAASAE